MGPQKQLPGTFWDIRQNWKKTIRVGGYGQSIINEYGQSINKPSKECKIMLFYTLWSISAFIDKWK